MEALRELGEGREGTVLLQGPGVVCPKRTLATLSRSFLPARTPPPAPRTAGFHFHQGQEKWKGLKVEIRKSFGR